MNRTQEPSDSPLPADVFSRNAGAYVLPPTLPVSPPTLPYLHGYVMGAYPPPSGPLLILDVDTLGKKDEFNEKGCGKQAAAPDEKCKNGKSMNVLLLVMHILGLLLFIFHIPSIAISLHMVKAGRVQRHRSAVLWFSFIELSAWVVAASLSWGYTIYPQNGMVGLGMVWWGWILIVWWWMCALAFGIPRVVFCWRENRQSTEFVPEPIVPQIRRKMFQLSIVCYAFGLVAFVPEVVSIFASLYLLKKGWIANARTVSLVLACVALELTGWFLAASMGWFFYSRCSNPDFSGEWTYYNGIWQDSSFSTYETFWDNYTQCEPSIYGGWVFIIIWWCLAAAFGGARILATIDIRSSKTTDLSTQMNNVEA